jgi:VanZ family protein
VPYAWLAIGRAALTVYGNLIPFEFRPSSLGEAAAAFREISYFTPSMTEARGDWMVSVVLFAAFAFTVMAAVSVDCPWDVGVGAAVLVVPASVLFSVAIEFLQVFFPPRTVSVNDIVVESLGAWAGVGLWRAAGQRLTDWWRRLAAARSVPALARLVLPGYLVLLVAVELMPFDLVLGASELVLKFEEGKIHMLPLHDLATPAALLGKAVSNAACFFPVGLLAALGSRRAWGRREWRRAARLALALAAAVELGQLLVYSRFCDPTDIVIGTAAVLAGAWVGTRYPYLTDWAARGVGKRRWDGRVVAAALVAWSLLLVNWWPCDFTTDPTRFQREPDDGETTGLRHMYWLPLLDYCWGNKYQALDQFGRRLAGFRPLGVLAALWLRRTARPHAGWVVGVLAVALPVAIETGKYFLPSHSPSVTNTLIETSGVVLGFLLARHLLAFPDVGRW